MALPVFHSAAPVASAASNAGLSLQVFPTGNPAGLLLVAFVDSYAVGGTPSAPAGWRGPFGGNGVWGFTKLGVLADSGTSVTFSAWTPEVIGTQNSGVVMAFDNAANFDLVKAAADRPMSGSDPRANWPGGRTSVANTLVLAVAGFRARNPGPGGSLVVTKPGSITPDGTPRVGYFPSAAASWLLVNEKAQGAAGQTAIRQAFAFQPGTAKMALFVLRDNQPPTAPNLASPPSAAVFDLSQPQTFSWVFGDPDPSDHQSDADLLVVNLTTGGTVTESAGTKQSFTFFGGFFNPGPHSWQVRTYDTDGNVSPWSAVRNFVPVAAPDTPVITAPVGGATIASPTATLTWTETDQETYQVRRVADAGGIADPSRVYFDSGEIIDSVSRSTTVTFDTTGRDEHVQVRVTFTAGIWSQWADVLVHVSFTPPPAPSLLVTADDTTASILVQYTNPAPSGSVPPATSVDIYRQVGDDPTTLIRVATGLNVNSSWTDYTPASGVDYHYQVVAVADDGATAPSTTLPGSGGAYGDGPYGAGPYGGT